MSVKFKMCKGESYCESEADIRKWLARKYIILLYNQVRFDPEHFLESSKIRESRIVYIPISSQVRNIHPFALRQSHLELQDHDLIQLDDWTGNFHEDLFNLSQLALLPYEWPDDIWTSVTIEMDQNRVDYDRARYTFFDLLSDVGGLSGMFVSIFSVFMGAWNFN